MVQMLSARVGQPFSIPLQEQLKLILNYKRADYFQKVIDKHPEQRKFFLKDFSAELERVDKAECPVEVGCDMLKTVHPVPQPVRSTHTMFDYIGDPDKGDAYRYMTPDQAVISTKYNKYTGTRPTYFYVNGYIYIYNDLNLEYINIRGIFADPKQLHDFKCNGVACYTDDDQYNIPEDVINLIIIDTLKNELRTLILTQEGEVEVTSNNT